jgi:hypothetical protein
MVTFTKIRRFRVRYRLANRDVDQNGANDG